MRKIAGVVVAAAALGLGLGGAPAAQAATPEHGGSWVAGHFPDYRVCQAAGQAGQRRHDWGHFDCDRSRNGRSHHHGNGRHGDRDTAWLLKVRR